MAYYKKTKKTKTPKVKSASKKMSYGKKGKKTTASKRMKY